MSGYDTGGSLADTFLPVESSVDGFGDNGAWWIIVLFALMNWSNNGWNNNSAALGYENYATSNEVQRGFDNQNTMANQREILAAVNAGTAQAVSATNQTFHDTLNALAGHYDELQRDIANVAVTQANALANQNQCCCNVLRAIDGVNYNAAMNTASINQNTTAQTQRVLDAITGNRMAEMQDQINQLQNDKLESKLSNQIVQSTAGVIRYPNSFSNSAGPNPFCGCSDGGCCGNI